MRISEMIELLESIQAANGDLWVEHPNGRAIYAGDVETVVDPESPEDGIIAVMFDPGD